jgi:hypothetical protein
MARARLSRSAAGRTRPLASGREEPESEIGGPCSGALRAPTAVIDRRYSGSLTSDFLFFQFRDRFVDLVTAKFVERHVLWGFLFAAADKPTDNSQALPRKAQ